MNDWAAVGDGGVLVRSRWIFNCYVIPDGGEGAPLIVDVGLPSHGRSVAEWLQYLAPPGSGSAPTIVATHLHSDHVGGLPAYEGQSVGQGARVVLPQRGQEYSDDVTPRTPGLRAVARIIPVFCSQRFSLGSLVEAATSPKVGYGSGGFALPVESPEWAGEGDRPGTASDWVTFVVPGHTDDSTAYYHEGSRTLIAGDAVLTVGGRAWFNPEYVDGPASAATEDRLRSLRVDVLLPGHGRPLVGTDLLASALGHDDRPPRRSRR